MKRRRQIGSFGPLCLFVLAGSRAYAEIPHGQALERWSNVFAGENIKLQVSVGELGDNPAGKAIRWSAVLETAVIARRESTVRQLDNPRLAVVPIEFQIPEGEPKTVLSVSIFVGAGDQDQLAKQLWVYPRDPFQRPVPNLDGNELVLFDPKKTTAPLLQESKLKFRTEKNIDALDAMLHGVLVIGEGVSFREFRGLPDAILRAASRGVKVLCLAPSAGTLRLSDDGAVNRDADRRLDPMKSFHLERAEILSQLDKHLDFVDWRGKTGPVGSTFQLSTKSNLWSVDIGDDRQGWPWIETEFNGGGRIIVCGFRCIEQWEAGPAPRHALWQILAHGCRPSHSAAAAANALRSNSRDE